MARVALGWERELHYTGFELMSLFVMFLDILYSVVGCALSLSLSSVTGRNRAGYYQFWLMDSTCKNKERH